MLTVLCAQWLGTNSISPGCCRQCKTYKQQQANKQTTKTTRSSAEKQPWFKQEFRKTALRQLSQKYQHGAQLWHRHPSGCRLVTDDDGRQKIGKSHGVPCCTSCSSGALKQIWHCCLSRKFKEIRKKSTSYVVHIFSYSRNSQMKRKVLSEGGRRPWSTLQNCVWAT